MNSNLLNHKVSSCLLYMLLVIFFSNRLNAQVVYTDIPDATPSATYSLDLNNDLVDDFLIQFDMTDKIMCKPQSGNAYSGHFHNGLYLPWALWQSSIICDTLLTWYGYNSPGTMAAGADTGFWVGQTDRYLALKLIIGPKVHYGWVRLDVVPSSTSFTVKDYAYESSPNTCIQAGQTNLSINENDIEHSFSVFPNPARSFITIKTSHDLKNGTLKVISLSGQTVKQLESLSGQFLSLETNDLQSGMYFIQIAENNVRTSLQKILIMN